MKKQLTGTYVKCLYCGKTVYKIPSRLTKYNFCSKEHTIAYLRSPMNTSMSKGWHQKPEAIKKIGIAGIGRKPTAENIEKLKEANRKRVWTDEQREGARLRKLGKKNTEEQNQKISLNAKRGWKNSSWKGRYAGYYAKHIWAEKYMKGPKICVDCGATEKERVIQASNKDHKYYKRLEDWKWRCVPCHRKYDLEHKLVHPEGKAKRFFAKANPTQSEILGKKKKRIT